MKEKKEKLVSIVGPTAIGKTDLSIHLAERFQGEILSGDSMQVYRGMDIGTAKITKDEMAGIPHHFIDILDPRESFSVSDFQALAKEKIKEVNERGRLPILVGGTGLYVQAITHGFQFAASGKNDIIRRKWQLYLEHHGPEALFDELQKKDPRYAQSIHPNNSRRVIRALEMMELTGRSMGEFQGDWTNDSPYHLVMIGLTMERGELYQRINQRVDLMMQQGLLEEIKRLLDQGVPETAQAFQAIGYKEMLPFLKGECPLHEAVELLKRNTRRFAKRQLTWFKRVEQIKWFDLTNFTQRNAIKERITQFVKESLSE